jgi:hypothetical protein
MPSRKQPPTPVIESRQFTTTEIDKGIKKLERRSLVEHINGLIADAEL